MNVSKIIQLEKIAFLIFNRCVAHLTSFKEEGHHVNIKENSS